jgi:hypothetical protein
VYCQVSAQSFVYSFEECEVTWNQSGRTFRSAAAQNQPFRQDIALFANKPQDRILFGLCTMTVERRKECMQVKEERTGENVREM